MTSIRFSFERADEFAELSIIEVQGLVITRRGKKGTAGVADWEHGGWEEMDYLKEEAIAALKKEGFEQVSESDQLNDELDAEYYRQRYDIEPPERLLQFVESAEIQRYDGWCARGLPMWSDDVVFRMHFRYALLPYLRELYDDDDLAREKKYVPLALLSVNGETSEFVAVDITDPKCPVSMWYHGSGTYYPVWDSLDEFLESLEESPEEKPFAERS